MFTLRYLAEFVGGTVEGDADFLVADVKPILEAESKDITFLANPKYKKYLDGCKAGAIITPSAKDIPIKNRLLISESYVAFARILALFHPFKVPEPGIHNTAVLDDTAKIGKDTFLGAHVVVEKGAQIGSRTAIYPGVYVGENVVIGDDTVIFPNVCLYSGVKIGCNVRIHAGAVIGSDGFGYAQEEGRHIKIPQVGTVIIGDDVEIGANVTIDRATLGETVIEDHVKIDNLVQIAHNVRIGEGSIVVAQVGISGSASLGKYVVLGGQAGVVGHVSVGDGTRVAAKSGISKDTPPGSTIAGTIGMPHEKWKKCEAMVRRLPHLYEEIQILKKKLKKIEDGVKS